MTREQEFDQELRRVGRLVSDDVDDDGMEDRVLSKVLAGPPQDLRIGRFVVRRCIGRGGMGAVHEAWDPELRRRVALKLLRKDIGSRGRRRRILEAEARALARLSHRHVVPVFEIGEHEGALFVVMELVDGRNLEAWQSSATRTVTEILHHYLQAGRGLAAAHRVGLVHRDFKAANVLVGGDGEVKVADFGLALSSDDEEDHATAGSSGEPISGTSRLRVGTRDYMAPEQIAFGTTDARSDQFSFCASLYEALCGVRPHDAESLAMLGEHPGRSVVPNRGPRRPPRWLASIIARGLEPRASSRWVSMDDLLDTLERTPRRRTLAAAFAGSACVAAIGWVFARDAGRPSCDPSAELVGVWNGSVEAALRTSTATEPRFAAAVRADVTDRLAVYANNWQRAYESACRASWITGTRTGRDFDESVACLDVARDGLGAAIDLLSGSAGETLARSDDILARLPDLDRCRDRRARGESPTERDRALEQATSRARLSFAAGEPIVALEVLDGLALADVDSGGFAISAWLARAEVLSELARFPEAEDALVRASSLALAETDKRLAVAAWGELVAFYSHAVPDLDRATLAAGVLDGLTSQVDLSATERAGIVDIEARLVALRGDPKAAVDLHRQAIALLETTTPNGPVQLATFRLHLGAALQGADEFTEARRVYEEVRVEMVELLGVDHPQVAAVDHALGSLALAERRIDSAVLHFQRALAVQEAAFGVDSVRLADSLAALAECARAAGRLADSEELAKRSWELQQKLPVHHPDRGSALAVLAYAHAELGQWSQALAEYQQLLRELDGRSSSEQNAAIQQSMGWLLCQLDRCVEARTHFERVLLETPREHILRVYADSGIAMVELAEHRPLAAMERAQRILRSEAERVGADDELARELRATVASASAAATVLEAR